MAFWSKWVSASPEAEFWFWFQKEEPKLFAFEENREAIFDSLEKAMQKVNPDLAFEFGPVQDGKRDFVISAGGIKSAFPAVEALYASAPRLPRWHWIKFRPRRSTSSDITCDGMTVKAADVHYVLAKDQDRVGIILFFGNYSESRKGTFGQIGFLFLDEVLGELAVETQVGFIEFMGRDSKYFAHSAPLSELAEQFDEYWKARSH